MTARRDSTGNALYDVALTIKGIHVVGVGGLVNPRTTGGTVSSTDPL